MWFAGEVKETKKVIVKRRNTPNFSPIYQIKPWDTVILSTPQLLVHFHSINQMRHFQNFFYILTILLISPTTNLNTVVDNSGITKVCGGAMSGWLVGGWLIKWEPHEKQVTRFAISLNTQLGRILTCFAWLVCFQNDLLRRMKITFWQTTRESLNNKSVDDCCHSEAVLPAPPTPFAFLPSSSISSYQISRYSSRYFSSITHYRL